MSARAELFLGIIAVATLATAIVQIGVLVAAGLLMRRAQRFIETVEQELRPIVGHLNAISRDAARAAALATSQVERVDRLMAQLAGRLEQALDAIVGFANGPLRNSTAFVTGFRAILEFLREARASRARARAEDEDPLFI